MSKDQLTGENRRRFDPDWKYARAGNHTHSRRPWSLEDNYEVTGADDLFPESVTSNLNKKNRWETVVRRIEEMADKEETNHKHSQSGAKGRWFTVPIPLPESATERPVTSCQLYTLHGYPRPSIVIKSNPDLIPLNATARSPFTGGQGQDPIILKMAKSMGDWGTWTASKPKHYIEMDLGRECRLTHIGTRGEIRSECWPTWRTVREWEHTKEQRDWLEQTYGAGTTSVRVFNHRPWNAFGYVTTYKVSTRLEGGVWCDIPNSFTGNHNWHEEQVNSLESFSPNREIGFIARYVRITPVGFEHSPTMHIQLYGSGQGKAGNAPSTSRLVHVTTPLASHRDRWTTIQRSDTRWRAVVDRTRPQAKSEFIATLRHREHDVSDEEDDPHDTEFEELPMEPVPAATTIADYIEEPVFFAEWEVPEDISPELLEWFLKDL